MRYHNEQSNVNGYSIPAYGRLSAQPWFLIERNRLFCMSRWPMFRGTHITGKHSSLQHRTRQIKISLARAHKYSTFKTHDTIVRWFQTTRSHMTIECKLMKEWSVCGLWGFMAVVSSALIVLTLDGKSRVLFPGTAKSDNIMRRICSLRSQDDGRIEGFAARSWISVTMNSDRN